MAEGRFISRSIATSGQLKRVSLEADYLFTRMIPHLDREGRIDGDPDVVKAMACPLRAELTPELISTCLAELDAVGLIEWYEVDGRQVAQFPGFKAHQRGMKPDRERASMLPSRDTQGAKPVRRILPSGVRAESSGTPPAPVAANSPTLAPKLSEVKVSQVKKSKDSAVAGNWVSDGAGLWSERVAPIEPGRFGRALKPMVKQYGWPATRLALLFYIEDTEGKPRRVEWFVADAVRCVRLGKMGMMDDSGGLTERGELARRSIARLA